MTESKTFAAESHLGQRLAIEVSPESIRLSVSDGGLGIALIYANREAAREVWITLEKARAYYESLIAPPDTVGD